MKENNDLVKRMGSLGFRMLEAARSSDANLTLADAVKSRDIRMWEGFPVVFANSMSKGLFDHRKAAGYLKNQEDRKCFNSLLAMSLALFEACDMKLPWTGRVFSALNTSTKKECSAFRDLLKNGRVLKIGNKEMAPERLMTTLRNYLAQTTLNLSELLSEKEEFGLEYSLSQVFSAKQKELFLKKLKGEKFNKTESEYFSRVVKKKVLALANTQLHRLARNLLLET